MDVAELFSELRIGETHEVVAAGLPEVEAVAFREFGVSDLRTWRVLARVRLAGSLGRRWTCSGVKM